MIGKLFAVVFGTLLLGLGANIDFGLAFGQGGTTVFAIMSFLSAAFLSNQGFRANKQGSYLWIFILRGLAIEAALFPVASLIMGIISPQSLGQGLSLMNMLIYSGLLGGILALVFLFIASQLRRRIIPLQEKSKKLGKRKNS